MGSKVSKSIMQQGEPRCYLCGKTVGLERHHVMTAASRPLAEKYGLWVYLCGETCHRGKNGVHQNRPLADSLKRMAQIAFEARHSHEEWMEIFRKNYL